MRTSLTIERPRTLAGCVLVVMLACGCDSTPARNILTAARGSKSRVISQGQIMPAGGFVQLSANPGDVVERVLVAVGESVSQGQVLLEMRSEQVSQAQLETLRKRREEALRERDTAIAGASRQVAAGGLKLEHLQAQKDSLGRKKELLSFAQGQVTASQNVLKKLESISENSVTSEFVGQLEIDRQRISMGEAELNYRQQSEAHRQSEEDLLWAERAAQSEMNAAQSVLEAAQASQAIEILDLEIKALVAQAAASRIIAPINGVILAVNATQGEASISLPLIEMADLDNLVCEIEINEMDAALVKSDQPATIRSRAFSQELSGHVTQKYQLVGRPQLRPMNPLARADYRTVTAVVELDGPSAALARDWLQLQVEVEITVPPANTAPAAPTANTP